MIDFKRVWIGVTVGALLLCLSLPAFAGLAHIRLAAYNEAKKTASFRDTPPGILTTTNLQLAASNGVTVNAAVPFKLNLDPKLFAKFAWEGIKAFSFPVTLAAAGYDLLCGVAHICLNGDSFEQTVESVRYAANGAQYDSIEALNAAEFAKGTSYNPKVRSTQCPQTGTAYSYCFQDAVPAGKAIWYYYNYARARDQVTAINTEIVNAGEPTKRPPTAEDWNAAEGKVKPYLEAAGSAQPDPRVTQLIEGLRQQYDLPAVPEVFPSSTSIAPTIQQARDVAGNVVSVTRTDIALKTEPLPAEPLTQKVTEVVKTTTTTTPAPTASNPTPAPQTTSTESTGEAPSPAEPPPEPTIGFDDVEDTQLQSQEIGAFSAQDWGGAGCPADPSISVGGMSMTIPVHVICGGLESFRPILLLLAALASAYILIGIRS